MPNLPAHLELANEAARRLDHPILQDNMGCFLLGSTAPDVRAMTRGSREKYHFAPLDFATVGAGVKGLFESHPRLQAASGHNQPTQAFIAGYITHLIADETWIVTMFRPYFGHSAVFQDSVYGKVMDRVFQLELDRQAWDIVDSTKLILSENTNRVSVDFIPSATLVDWQQWVISSLDGMFSWERLKFMARRIAAGDETHTAHRIASEFLQQIPDSLKQLYQIVPARRLTDYKERAVKILVQTVEEYLP